MQPSAATEALAQLTRSAPAPTPRANDLSGKQGPDSCNRLRDVEIAQLNLPSMFLVSHVEGGMAGSHPRGQTRSGSRWTLGPREPQTPIRFGQKLTRVFWLAQCQNLPKAKRNLPERNSGSRGGKFAKKKKKGGDPIPRKLGTRTQRSARLVAAPRLHHEPRAATEACRGRGSTSGGPQKRPLHQTPRARETWRELGGLRSPLLTEEDTTSPPGSHRESATETRTRPPGPAAAAPREGTCPRADSGGSARCREAPGAPGGGAHSRRPSRGPGTWDARAGTPAAPCARAGK